MASLFNSPRRRLITMLVIVLALIAVSSYFIIKDSQHRLIEHQALTLAEIVAKQASSARSVYSRDIFAKLEKHFDPALMQAHTHMEYPLPAEFLKKLALESSKTSEGLYEYRLVSKWNISEDHSLNTPFLKEAWAFLEQQEEQVKNNKAKWQLAHKLVQENDKETLYILAPDIANNETCVACHNMYEKSFVIVNRRTDQNVTTNKQFQLNDLMGALFIKIPLDNVKLLSFKQSTKSMLFILMSLIGGIGLLAFFLLGDIVKAKEKQRKLLWQSNHDRLTKIHNRHYFEERAIALIAATKETDKQHAICYLDLDQFKIVNDTCGHGAGDELLIKIADLINDEISDKDVFARVGGDEFTIILHDCTSQEAVNKAQQVCDKLISTKFVYDNHTFDIGVSIGVVAVDKNSDSFDTVMFYADSACYAAKEAGKNCVREYNEDDATLSLSLGQKRWVPIIVDALKEKRIVLYAQKIHPVAKDKNYTHYEVLTRILDENNKVISPRMFLPAAERYGLMTKIDLEVIKKTFKAMEKNKFCALGENGFVSINLSGQSISDSRFLSEIRELLKKYNVNPKAICFEITESAAIANMEDVQAFIQDMRAIGVRFALDDFGTGLSSFTYLKQFDVDYLKIDGSFVKDITTDKTDQLLVKSINDMAHSLGLKTVAEFVENKEVFDLLTIIGIDYIQGYYHHKPERVKTLRKRDKVN